MSSLDRAIEIGHELNGIHTAIEQAGIGFSNKLLAGVKPFDWDMAEKSRQARAQFYETELFTSLSARREALRMELLALWGQS